MAGPWEKYGASAPVQEDPVAQQIVDGPKPWEKFSPESKKIDRGEAALQGFGQAGTFGHLPNIQAAVEPVTDKIFGFLTGKKVDDDRSYVERRDTNIKRDKELSKSGAYTAGQIAGSLATPIPGSGLIKGAGVGAKLGKAALGGAIAGTAYNPGEVEGEVNPLQTGDRLKGGAIGGLIGAGTQGLLSVGGKLASSWGNKGKGLEKASNMSAVSSIGAQKGDIKKLMNKSQIDSVGKFLKEEKLVGIGKNYEDAYNGAQGILKEEGPRIGEIYNSVQQKISDPKFLQSLKPDQAKKLAETSLSPSQIASELGSKFSQELKGKAGGKAALSRITGELESLAELGDDVNIDQLLDTRRSFDDLINYDKSVKDMPLAQEYLKKTRDFIQNKIDGRIKALDEVVGGDQLKQLKLSNKRYSNASNVFNIAKQKVAGEEAKMSLGIPELMVGGAVGLGDAAQQVSEGDFEGLLGSAGKGILAGAAMKGARRYGPGIATKILDTGAKAARLDPTAPLARGASGLLNKINPTQMGGLIERVRK